MHEYASDSESTEPDEVGSLLASDAMRLAARRRVLQPSQRGKSGLEAVTEDSLSIASEAGGEPDGGLL
jgi:hypothetical protein